MTKSRISMWEKFKRMIAHAFEFETKLEQEERKQTALRIQHEEYVAKLMEENEEAIRAFHEQRRQQKEWEREQARLKAVEDAKRREMEERVKLYLDNRPLQKKLVYGEVIDMEPIEVADEIAVTEEE